MKMTDAVQPMPRFGANALKPKGDPKANRAQYYMLAHGCHLSDLARYLGGPITAVRARAVRALWGLLLVRRNGVRERHARTS